MIASNAIAADFATSGGATGTSTQVARQDHHHDARYVTREGLLQVGNTAPVAIDLPQTRYIVEARASDVGLVVPINTSAFDALCRDIDGCTMTIMMVDFTVGFANLVAARRAFFAISQDHPIYGAVRIWRFDQTFNDAQSFDGGSGVAEVAVWDCIFTDGEKSTDANNGRADMAAGFGLLNLRGGSFSDTTTTCRIVIDD